MVTVRWKSPAEDVEEGEIINVSSYASDAYKIFSPFSSSSAYNIPVPGNEKIRAHSVEGIWQGLKQIDGQTDFSLLTQRPKKRKGTVEGHLFGNALLADVVEARQKIYVPAYTFHVVNNALPLVQDDLCSKEGTVYFYDVNANGDRHDGTKPYSHAHLLTEVLGVLKDSPLPPFTQRPFTYLNEELQETLAYRSSLEEDKRFLLDEIVTFGYLFSNNELREYFSLCYLRESGLALEDKVRERMRNYQPTRKVEALFTPAA